MKLKTQFTVPNKKMQNLYCVNKLQTLCENIMRETQDYPLKNSF